MMFDLIMIVGPTAVGKTRLSLELAQAFSGEIINGDAMQFYRGLDIGTAKIKEEEKQGIKHHLLDMLDPHEETSVVDYQTIVREKIKEITKKNKLPIIVGGSGLYLSSILFDYKFPGPSRNDDLTKKYEGFTTEMLVEILKKTKPELAKNTDLANRRRVLRALEKENDDFQEEINPYYPNVLVIGLDLEREKLYERIDNRVMDMVNEGLLKEVKSLYDQGIFSQATMAIGYKELFPYFRGETTLEEALVLIKRNSRRYAKRQLTWFRNRMNAVWFKVDLENFDKTIQEVKEYIKKRS
ncbi:MAG: tRNA (adenosine(37)-N6)-dimethylallyltransferase MiaA [Candidatus Izemoplasmatales bacterium]|jgi:tRNA dimethylallyltransferase|nr:tRNA (adenosine(37)-N6)-dimethylallyltransferase MiaA [Candidatus Izemoplasmatales bacterium]